MFGFLGILLIYALLSFGGVLSYSALLVYLLMLAGFTGLVLTRYCYGRLLDIRLALVLLVALATSLWVSPRVGVPLFAGVWAFHAVRDSEPRHLMRFLHFLLFLGIGEAFLGLAQHFIAPGWIFGYINEGSTSSGTLINRNHFAGLLEMLIPVSFGLAYVAARRDRDVSRSYVYLMTGAFIALAVIFSASRMGIVALFATVCFLVAVVRMRESQRRLATAIGLGLVGLALSTALWIGVEAILERYGGLLETDVVLNEGRFVVYLDSLKLIAENPWGVGVGRYRDVFRQYQTRNSDLLFDHAHNDYIETIAEWGILLALVFWVFVIRLLFRSVQGFLRTNSPESLGVLLVVIGAIFSLLVHSLTDFNLQILSNAILFCIYVGIGAAMVRKLDFDAVSLESTALKKSMSHTE